MWLMLCKHGGAERRRDRRPSAEPAREAGRCLMQEHAEAVDRCEPARSCLREERRLERNIHQVGDQGAFRQRREVDGERRLSGHAQRRRVDEEPRPHEQRGQLVPSYRPLPACPNVAASASARASVRLTIWSGPNPRCRSAQTTARAAPPAPSTTAAPGSRSQPTACSSRLAMKPGASVLSPIKPPSVEPDGVDRADGARCGVHLAQPRQGPFPCAAR